MHDLAIANRAFYWATLFMRGLYAHGLRHVILSPGSRSTPLTLAFAAFRDIKKHVVLDERSAAFMALGIGKATGKPAALVCTSGTAAANYYPAVVEARMAGVPLLVLTADRPPNLRNIGAPQAIDQVKMFADYPVFFHDAGEPQFDRQDIQRLHLLSRQALQASLQQQGPAHINFPFRKPLEPEPAFYQDVEAQNRQLKDDAKDYTLQTEIRYDNCLQESINRAQKPLVIVGPEVPGRQHSQKLLQWAEEGGMPVVAEPGSVQIEHASPNLVDSYDALLRGKEPLNSLRPDLILRFGQQPVSKALEIALSTWHEVDHLHFSSSRSWQDATASAGNHLPFDASLFDQIKPAAVNPAWMKQWQEADDRIRNHRDTLFKQDDPLTDGAVYHATLPLVPEQSNIFLSNSFPVRDMALFGGVPQPHHRVFVTRGASGIDGILSSAIGSTLASGRPGTLFIGDLAMLHDANALLSTRMLEQPLVAIVLNNGGGNIFRMLPIADHKAVFHPYFETPQQADFEKLAETYDITYSKAGSGDELCKQYNDSINRPGLHLLECRTDSDRSMEQRRSLWNF